MLLKCPRCGYIWNYKGKLQHATCPNCKKFFKIRGNRYYGKKIVKKTKHNLNLKCPYCGYTWHHKGTLEYVTCPSCGRKFRITKSVIQKEKEEKGAKAPISPVKEAKVYD